MPVKSTKKATGSKESVNFEQSLKRLEEITKALEKGAVTLDDVMTMYEEGVRISNECLEQLSRAELQLKRLSKDAKGNFELFDEGVGEEG